MIRRLPFLVASLVFAASLRASSPAGAAVVQTLTYDSAKSQLSVRVVNDSPKDITAMSLTIFIANAGGPETSFSWSIDLLWGIISSAEQGYDVRPGASHGFGAGSS